MSEELETRTSNCEVCRGGRAETVISWEDAQYKGEVRCAHCSASFVYQAKANTPNFFFHMFLQKWRWSIYAEKQ